MNLPKFGLLTNSTIDILEEIETIARLGFDYVEIGIEWPEGTSEILIKKKNKILKLLKEYNIPAIAHTTWWINFGSQYESVRKAWISEAKKKVDIAKMLNIGKINFHFYSDELVIKLYKNYRKSVLSKMIQSLKEVVSYAASKDIVVICENIPRKRELLGINEFEFIQHNVPGLKVHLDVGHAFIENGMKGIKEYIEAFSKDIEHIHIHDNHGESDEHLPVGKGKIDWNKVVELLKKINYDKTITFEVFTSKKDAVKSREKIRKLWMKNNL